MSLDSTVSAALLSVCPRVYTDYAPSGAVQPYIVWQQIGGAIINPLGNELPNKRNARIQTTVWATMRAAANAMALQVEVAMVAASARPMGALHATADAGLNLRGAIQDFTIWGDR